MEMPGKLSIRTTLTAVGIILVALMLVVGALGLTAPHRASESLNEITRGDPVAICALNDASKYQLGSRLLLDHVNALTAAGRPDDVGAIPIPTRDVMSRVKTGGSFSAWREPPSKKRRGSSRSTVLIGLPMRASGPRQVESVSCLPKRVMATPEI
jgi:methyl-accepting chemotaxis protein-1 (serine sensor receptor)